MTRRVSILSAGSLILLWITCSAVAQQPAQTASQAGQAAAAPYVPEDHRPALFLRESWKKPSINEEPVGQEDLENQNLELKLYGHTKQGFKPDTGVWLINRVSPKDDPTFIYTGPCMSPCALALRDKNNYVNLTGLAKIRWRTKQSGFHYLRPIVKLADGTWLVGDYAEGPHPTDWRESEFSLALVHWHYLNIEHVVTTKTSLDWVPSPDLSRVDEIGFTDLMPGNVADNGHGNAGASRIDWIEVYGSPVPRSARTQTNR